jgi:hypothetical protein
MTNPTHTSFLPAHCLFGVFRRGKVSVSCSSRFRLRNTVFSAPGALEPSRRDVSVMTRISVPRPSSTGAATTPAPGPQLRQGAPHPSMSSHRRGRGRAHVHAALKWLVSAPPTRSGGASGSVAAPACRHRQVLPFASTAGTDSVWSSGVAVRSGLGACRSSRARRDPRAATPTEPLGRRLVRAGAVHPLTRGSMELEHRQRLLGRNAVPAVDVALGGRDDTGVSGVASGAALSRVACLAPRRWLMERVGDRRNVWPEVMA